MASRYTSGHLTLSTLEARRVPNGYKRRIKALSTSYQGCINPVCLNQVSNTQISSRLTKALDKPYKSLTSFSRKGYIKGT
jgi:hypothetical protein